MHLYGQCIGGLFILSLLKAQPHRVSSAVLAQPIGRVGPMPAARPARFEAWVESVKDRPEATAAVVDAFYRNLYEPGFAYSVGRAFVATCSTPSGRGAKSSSVTTFAGTGLPPPAAADMVTVVK